MSAKLGRNARLLKDGQAIGYGKNISVKATRMFKASNKLLAMINKLPKKSERIFGTYELRGYRSSFVQQRKRTAFKLQNLESIK